MSSDETNHSDNAKARAPAFDELARQYLDLWQDQWTALANDPVVAEAMARGFQMMGPGAAAFANFANLLGHSNLYAAGGDAGATMAQAAEAMASGSYPGGPFAPTAPRPAKNDNNNSGHEQAKPATASNSTKAGAATTGAASAGGNGDMAQLLDRLAAMEQRLADLASAINDAGEQAPRAGRDTGTGGCG